MNVYWLQAHWFGERYNPGNEVQKNYHTVEIPPSNIFATIALTIFSPGIDLDNNVTGLAASGIKQYEYIDANGIQRTVVLDHWESHLYVKKCVSITFAFHVQRAWAKAEGMIYYYT